MKKKVALLVIIIAIIGILITSGFTIYVNNYASKWDKLLYPGTKIQNLNLGGKTKEEAKKILTEKYGNEVLKKKIQITAEDKEYIVDYSKLTAVFNIDQSVDSAMKYGKNLNIFEKYKAIRNPTTRNLNMKFTFNQKPIEDLIASIAQDIKEEPHNASITIGSGNAITITPDKKGVKLNSDKLKKDILNSINGDLNATLLEMTAPIDEISASITQDKLKLIDTKISSFSTDFSSSSGNRASNIITATKSINGKVLMPGEAFSFNSVVGERTVARGYKEAPVLIGNLVDSGLGGGICQVSTTLYNAVVRANILATERTHHTLQSHYIGLGMDATVDWGNIDYKFTNTLDYPIYIEGFTENGRVYFNVYSNSTLGKRTYDLVNEVYATLNSGVKYQDDPNQNVGYENVIQPGYTGYRVRVYKETFENGNLIEKKQISDDYYAPVDEVIVRGTKKS